MSTKTTTNTNENQDQTQMPIVPPAASAALGNLTNQIEGLNSQPATSYVAPQNSLQTQANNMGSSLLTGVNPNYTQAGVTINGNSSITPSAINGYLSPYLSNVLGTTNQQLAQNAGIQDAGLEAQGAQSGAFGGDRFGVAQGILGGQQQLALGQTDANILNTGYNNATSTALSNAQLGQTAGQNLTNLGVAQTGSNIANTQELANLGGALQSTQQAQATAPIALAGTIAQLLGQNQFALQTGQSGVGNMTGTSTSTTTDPMAIISGLLGGVGSAAQGIGSAVQAFSPASLLAA